VGTDRWSTVAIDDAGDLAGYATKEDAVRAELRQRNDEASIGSILRAIDPSERMSAGDAPIVVETSEGLPLVIRLENVNGGWRVTGADSCRRRAG
jgi:hypothetical protein